MQQHADGQARHQPRLDAPRQHAARHRPTVDDRRRAWGFDLLGHGYRSRCSNANRALPSAR